MALTREQIETEAKAFLEKKKFEVDGLVYIDYTQTLIDFGVFIQVLNNTDNTIKK